jgi:hypothetical protein
MPATKNRNTETKRVRNTEPVVVAPTIIVLPPTPTNAGDWICNAPPDKYPNGMYYDYPCIVGRPRAMKKFTEDQLIQKGLVGIYFLKKP